MANPAKDPPVDGQILGETTDPDGTRVVLLNRIWHSKVLTAHPEMDGDAEAVLQAVSTPTHTVSDPVFPARLRYHLRGSGPSRWLLVVVSYEQEPARIITAFGSRKDPRSWNR